MGEEGGATYPVKGVKAWKEIGFTGDNFEGQLRIEGDPRDGRYTLWVVVKDLNKSPIQVEETAAGTIYEDFEAETFVFVVRGGGFMGPRGGMNDTVAIADTMTDLLDRLDHHFFI